MKIITASFILFLIISFHVQAQLSFVRVDTVQVIEGTDTLTNAWAGGLNYPMFCEMDLNGDGIMDLVIYDNSSLPDHNRIMPFINNGTPGKVDYHYAPQYISHFPTITGFMVTYDYNKDGKMDLFTLADSGFAAGSGIMAYRNDFNAIDSLNFTLAVNPIMTQYALYTTNVFGSQVSVPSFVDINNDSAMDIISWPDFANGSVEYQKNVAVDSGWSLDSLRFVNVTQCWGGFALQLGTSNNTIDTLGISCQGVDASAHNQGQRTMANDDTQSIIMVYDNDGDGLKDALIGGYADNNALFLHNGGTPEKDSMTYFIDNFPSYDTPINLPSFPYFFLMDVNNDGAKDLIVTPHNVSNFRGVQWYKNMGTTTHPDFHYQKKRLLQQDMIDIGAGAAPQLFDVDADGLPDLLIGDESYFDTSGVSHKGIALYKNIGTPSVPKFQLITRDYAGIDEQEGIGGTLCPTFGDLNGDGATDMIVGMGNGPTEAAGNGHLLYFENTAGPGNPANFVLVSTFFDSINVDGNSAPQLYDLNHDGLLDLVVGNSFGLIKYYKNIGTPTTPLFSSKPTKDTLGGIITHPPGTSYVTGYASPFFYNDNGTDKLIVGTEDGEMYVYDGINGNITANYNLIDSLVVNGEEGARLIPFIGDINNDGRPDMLIGNYNGGLSLYLNSDTTPAGINELPGIVHPSFNVFPNPASDELHVSFYHLQNAHATFEILNGIGQLIYKTSITESTMTIPLNDLSNGIYLVRFVSDNNTQSQKIVVQKHLK